MKIFLLNNKWYEKTYALRQELVDKYSWRLTSKKGRDYELGERGWMLFNVPIELAAEFVLMGVAEVINEKEGT